MTASREVEEALRDRLERLRRLHEAALAVAAPVGGTAEEKGRLLATIVRAAVEALGGMAGRLVVADDAPWEDLVPGSQRRDGHVAVRHTGTVGREPLARDGDVRHVLETGEAVYVEDIREPSRFGTFPAARARGVGSFAVAPLRAGERVLGALTVDFARVGALGPEERETLTLFAGHAAAALERAALLHLERRHAAERAARDAAEAELARFTFLSEASAAMASSLDYETTLRRVAELAVPRVAAWCIVYLVDGGGGVQRVAMAYADPTWGTTAERIAREFSIDPAAAAGVPRVLRTGKPTLRRRVTPVDLAADVDEPERLAALVGPLEISSWMCVPLVARGQTLGAMSFMASGGRRFGRADLELAEAIARRAALAVDNARLYAAEQAARAAAEAAARARDEFLSVAAHELKTPLTSVLGLAEVLLRALEREGQLSSERLGRALRTIVEQGARLRRLTEQLLDVSRLELGRVALERRAVDVVALARRVAETHPAAETHAVTCRAAAERAEAWVDPLRVEQVLTNLLDNAARYAPRGSAIEVEVRDAGGSAGGDEVVLSVRDRGPGVAPEHRERVFDRFYQVDERAAAPGLGLGLAICREIAELHGGLIGLESPPDGGARFVVRLPCRAGG